MKNNTVIVIIFVFVVGISVGIFGLSLYQNINNYNNQTENGNNNQTSEEENKITSIDEATAKELFNMIIEKPALFNLVGLFQKDNNKTKWSINEIDANYIAFIIKTNFEDSLNTVQICGTEHETKLKTLGIIGELNKGQYDCKSEIFFTAESVRKASVEIFGKVLPQLFESNTNKTTGNYIYYSEGEICIFRYSGASHNDYSIKSYDVKDDIASIDFTDNYRNQSYRLNFEISGENFYFESIERLS